MRPFFVPAAALFGVILAVSANARALAAQDNGPWLTALSAAFVVMDMQQGDLDGDGRDETVVCYREDIGRTDQASGVAIFQGRGVDARPAFHVQLEKALCEKVRINNKKLGVLLVDNQQLVWSYGTEIRFRTDGGGLFAGATVRASSSADSGHGADKAFDNDLTTSWAEGVSGTGIGQTLTVRFKHPTSVGAIAIFPGSGGGSRAFFDNNRIHRASLEAKTEADLGDTGAGIDVSALGIDSMGDRVEFLCENKPQVTYVKVNKRDVVELELRIESVYLGDKRDDTSIAELEIVPIFSYSHTAERALPVRKDAVAPHRDGAAKNDPPPPDETLKKLDATGRSIVTDDL